MATKGFVLYLLSGFSVAVLSVLFINDHPINQNTFSPHLSSLNNTFSHHPYGPESTTWPVSLLSLFRHIMCLFTLIMHVCKTIEKNTNTFRRAYVFGNRVGSCDDSSHVLNILFRVPRQISVQSDNDKSFCQTCNFASEIRPYS